MATTDAPDTMTRGAFPRALTILTVRGVPVRVHLSWVVIAALVLWVFWTRFSTLLGAYGVGVVLGASAALALIFFAGIVAHELGHAITSLNRRIPVSGITLFLLGGVTESTREAERARDEAAIVGAGPFVSLVLASAFALAHAVAPGPTPYGVVTGYAAWLNLLLAVFNLIPGYPLDGGRLLRAVLWGVTGDPHRATRWAARVGQVFAAILLLGGLNGVLDGPVPRTDGPFRWFVLLLAGNGVWGLLIGFFLLRGAIDAHRRARGRETLARRTAGEVMGALPPSLPADLTLAAAARRIAERPSLLWPVGEPAQGGVRLSDLTDTPEERWGQVRLADLARPLEAVTVDVGASLDDAVDRLLDAPGQMLFVSEHGRPVGLLTPSLLGGLLR